MNGRRLPDFFIIGAQKSGTASLSALLSSRPDVFMCRPREPMFFCRDDVVTHPHTFLANGDLWRSFDWQGCRESLLDAYAELFSEAGPAQCAGEGSATYLPSRAVPERIASVLPRAKLIALLRNPIDRAYSAYFHHLKNFRVVHTFEEQLKFEPWDILETGNYYQHLERYLRFFPRQQLLVLPFEEFASNAQGVLDRVCTFLGLPPAPLNAEVQRSNAAVVPRSMQLQRVLNMALRLTGSNFEAGPVRALSRNDDRRLLTRLLDTSLRQLGKLNRGPSKYPRLRPGTRELLRAYYVRQNQGLSTLVDVDFGRFWPEFRNL